MLCAPLLPLAENPTRGQSGRRPRGGGEKKKEPPFMTLRSSADFVHGTTNVTGVRGSFVMAYVILCRGS